MKTTTLNNYNYQLARNAINKLNLHDVHTRSITLEEIEESLYWSFDHFSDLVFVQVTTGSWKIAGSNKFVGIERMKYLIENFA